MSASVVCWALLVWVGFISEPFRMTVAQNVSVSPIATLMYRHLSSTSMRNHSERSSAVPSIVERVACRLRVVEERSGPHVESS